MPGLYSPDDENATADGKHAPIQITTSAGDFATTSTDVITNNDENPMQDDKEAAIPDQITTLETGPFATMSPDVITNKIILTVLRNVGESGKKKKLKGKDKEKKKKLTWKQVATWMSAIYGKPFKESSLHTNFKLVKKWESKLSKSKRDKDGLDSFYEETYSLPGETGKRKMFVMTDEVDELLPECSPKRTKLDPFEQAAKDIGAENAELRNKLELQNERNERLKQENLHSIESLKTEIERLKQENLNTVDRLNTQAERLKQQNSYLTNALSTNKQRLKHVYAVMGKVTKPKYLLQSIQRKNASIARWRSEAIKWKKAAKKCQSCKSRLQTKSGKLKQLQQQTNNRKCRTKKNKNKIKQPQVTTQVLTENLKAVLGTVQTQKDVIAHMENEIMENEENRNVIPTREGQRIHPTFKETSMYLQELGIAEGSVGPAIDRVVTTLTDMKFDGQLPSKSSQQRIGSEMRAVAKQHMRNELKGKQNLTLKYDGTTKNGRHLVEVQIATEKDTFTLGVQETAGGTAADYVECIQELANNVDTDIMSNITCTMTDRCITNNAIDRQLEKETGNTIHSFRCALHPLDTIHKQAEKKVKEEELTLGIQTEKEQMPYMNRGESTTQALLRAFDKLMHCSASGLPKELPYFLHSIGVGGKYPRWVGNRFNIFFVNAGLLFLYKDHVLHFFQRVVLPRNNLHHAVHNALRVQNMFPMMRSLGLLDKFFTGPWMRWQGEKHNILETCGVFTAVLQKLEGADCKALIHGFDTTAFGTPAKKDGVYEKLIEPADSDSQTSLVFRSLLDEAGKVMTRQLEDYLPGGKFYDPSPSLQAEAASCTSNNISGERVFAMWDARQMQAKSASMDKVSSKTTFKSNKVREHFLAGKSKKERADIINAATSEARKDRLADKAREAKLESRLKDKLDDSRKLIEKREQNRRAFKERVLEDVIEHGLWQSEADIQEGLKNKSKTRASAILKSQIRFRIDMLGCQPTRKIVYKNVSQEDVVEYLIELLSIEIPEIGSMLCGILTDPESIVGFEFNQNWASDSDDNVCKGSIVKCVQDPGKDVEYVCQFEGEEDVTVQTVAEVLADMVVGDLYFYV